MATPRQKRWSRRRRLGAAAKKTKRTKRQTRTRKQAVRQSGRKRGGR